MVEPIEVFSLLISPCLAYLAGVVVFWGVEQYRKQSSPFFKSELKGGQSS